MKIKALEIKFIELLNKEKGYLMNIMSLKQGPKTVCLTIKQKLIHFNHNYKGFKIIKDKIKYNKFKNSNHWSKKNKR